MRELSAKADMIGLRPQAIQLTSCVLNRHYNENTPCVRWSSYRSTEANVDHLEKNNKDEKERHAGLVSFKSTCTGQSFVLLGSPLRQEHRESVSSLSISLLCQHAAFHQTTNGLLSSPLQSFHTSTRLVSWVRSLLRLCIL